MQILTLDIGTGTQDIHLYDSRLSIENGYKLVLPSPTLIVRRQIQEASARRQAILLSGRLMGGGPCTWAAQAHARAGLTVYATAEAALTFDDELAKVEAQGIRVVSEVEARRLAGKVRQISMADVDLPAIQAALAHFGVDLKNLAALAVAVFDHGNAPAGVSDRQFRFDYLAERLQANPSLTSLAYPSTAIPAGMTRLGAVAATLSELDCPLVLMDTAPAAVLGVTFDPQVATRPQKMIANIGNFHTLAFRMDGEGVVGLFEHHTGEIDALRLQTYLRALADGTLENRTVFDDMGHGALLLTTDRLEFGAGEWDVAMSGPRRAMFPPQMAGGLRAYHAVPFGDMMLAGNIGLLAGVAACLPALADEVRASLAGLTPVQAPWDA